MQTPIIDGDGLRRVVITAGVETVVNRSSLIQNTGASQELMPANADRSGCFFQNIGTDNMTLNELGQDATSPSSFVVLPLGTWPPPGYPLTTGAISVAGVKDDAYVAREW